MQPETLVLRRTVQFGKTVFKIDVFSDSFFALKLFQKPIFFLVRDGTSARYLEVSNFFNRTTHDNDVLKLFREHL